MSSSTILCNFKFGYVKSLKCVSIQFSCFFGSHIRTWLLSVYFSFFLYGYLLFGSIYQTITTSSSCWLGVKSANLLLSHWILMRCNQFIRFVLNWTLWQSFCDMLDYYFNFGFVMETNFYHNSPYAREKFPIVYDWFSLIIIVFLYHSYSFFICWICTFPII